MGFSVDALTSVNHIFVQISSILLKIIQFSLILENN